MATGYQRGTPIGDIHDLTCNGLVWPEPGPLPIPTSDWIANAWMPSDSGNIWSRWIMTETLVGRTWTPGIADFSIEAWIHPRPLFTGTYGVDDPFGVDECTWMGFIQGPNTRAMITFQNTTIRAYFRTAADGIVTVTGPVIVGLPARWYYIAVNVDRGGNLELFVDTLSYGAAACGAAGAMNGMSFYYEDEGDTDNSCPAIGSLSAHNKLLTRDDLQKAYYNGLTNEFGATSMFAYKAHDVFFLTGAPTYITDVNTDDSTERFYNPNPPVLLGDTGVLFKAPNAPTVTHAIWDRSGNEMHAWGAGTLSGWRFGNLSNGEVSVVYR